MVSFCVQKACPKTGEARSRAGMPFYRVEAGKLVETWLTLLPPGPTWTDALQEYWAEPAALK
jgi:hypothetical protein